MGEWHRRRGIWVPGRRPLLPIAGGSDFPFVASQGFDFLVSPSPLNTTASPNTKAAWTQLVASTPVPYAGLMMTVTLAPAGGSNNFLVDIGFGAASGEVVVVPNIYLSSPDSDGHYATDVIFLPIYVPVGTRISARQACDQSSSSPFTVLGFHGSRQGFGQSTQIGTYEACGVDVANSRGTSFSAIGTGTGSWVQLISATSFAYQRMMLRFGNPNTGTGNTHCAVDLGIGPGGSEQVLVGQMHFWLAHGVFMGQSSWDTPHMIPAGSRLAVRMNAADSSGMLAYGALYGMG